MQTRARKEARIIVIGNEVLKGETRDSNSHWLIKELFKKGIMVKGVTIIRDEKSEIISTILREKTRCSYLFITGGIGPTHDDITRSSIAEAFHCKLKFHEGIAAKLQEYYGNETDEIVLSMAQIPEIGKPLRDDPGLPGFQIENIFVFPGYPHFMKMAFRGIEGELENAPCYTEEVTTSLNESLFAMDLAEIEREFPQVEIGSYPTGYESDQRFSVTLRLFSYHRESLDKAVKILRSAFHLKEDGKLAQGTDKINL